MEFVEMQEIRFYGMTEANGITDVRIYGITDVRTYSLLQN